MRERHDRGTLLVTKGTSPRRILVASLVCSLSMLTGCDSFDDWLTDAYVRYVMESEDVPVDQQIADNVITTGIITEGTTETATEATTESTTETATEEPEPETVTVSFAGDCTLGGYLGQGTGNTFREYYDANGIDFFFKNVRGIFEKDDITFVNLEGPLTNYPIVVEKEFPISGIPEYADILSGGSIEVCNMTNNHIFDCGQNGFDETAALLTEREIQYCGEGYSARLTRNGIQVSCLGYRGQVNSKEVQDKIQNDIETEREAGADVICVMFHYGEESVNYSNGTQEGISHFAIDAGADIVVGSHPHVIQGIEKYNGKVICYSMGNFSFGANRNPSDKDTYIFQQTFVKNPDGTVEYGESKVIPCRLSEMTDRNTYQPTPYTGEDAERVLERLRQYSSKYECSFFDEYDGIQVNEDEFRRGICEGNRR